VSPAPTDTDIDPELPPAALPDSILIAPELPEVVTPVLNSIWPLIPADPALEVRNTIDPLDFEDPLPDNIETAPPVTALLRPATPINDPPTSEALRPLVNLI
jgi:hypothetical protein